MSISNEKLHEVADMLKTAGVTIIEQELLIQRLRARNEKLEEAVELLLAERNESVGRMAEA